MKNSILLSFLLIIPAFAGTSPMVTQSAPPAMNEDSWNWFVGGTAGYLLDAESEMYTFQFGANSPWSFSGWNVALYGEAGWTENNDALDGFGPLGNAGRGELEIVPMTFNVKIDRIITGGLSFYAGAGAGAAYLDADYENGSGQSHADDWIFTAQASAGVAYHVNEHFELFGGARWIYFDDPAFKTVSLDDDVLLEGGLRFHF